MKPEIVTFIMGGKTCSGTSDLLVDSQGKVLVRFGSLEIRVRLEDLR